MDAFLSWILGTIIVFGIVLGLFALLLPSHSRGLRATGISLAVISFLTGCVPLFIIWPGEDIPQLWFLAFCAPMAVGLLSFALCLRGKNL